VDAITGHLYLPEREHLDKPLGYETLISRELDHAIAELERLRDSASSESSLPKQSQEDL
jgi:hypothetical protein